MRGLLGLRVNFAITFLGAFLLIFLIRLTGFLPSQYYFSFSKLVTRDRGPFLVEPPSVTGAKLCELLRKNGISPETLQSAFVDCRLIREEEDKRHGSQKFSAEAIDRIYSVALRSDGVVRDTLLRQLRGFTLAPLGDQEFNEIIDRSKTVNDVFESLNISYNRLLGDAFLRPLGEAYKGQLSNVIQTRESAPEPKEVDLGLTPEDTGRIRKGNEHFIRLFNEGRPAASLRPIQKSNVDAIIYDTIASWDVPDNLARFYTGQIGGIARAKLSEAFVANAIELKEKKEARQLMFRQISLAGIGDYLIAVVVRLSPVILLGFVLGILFGRRELASIGLAAALAAFLLSWPLMLMWEKLVGQQWQGHQLLFTLFYTVYVFSFFITARMSAILGAGLRNIVSPLPPSASPVEDGTTAVTSKEVAINILAGIVTNGLVYAWNVLLPLAAA